MNLLDLLLLALMISAATTGYRFGLIARSVAWAGAVVGLGLSTVVAPEVLGLVSHDADPSTRLLVGLMAVLVTTSLLSLGGEWIGLRVRRIVHATPARSADRVAGAIAGALSVLLFTWLLLPAAAEVPGAVARQVRQSAIVALIDALAPAPPDTARALGALVDRSGIPDVFADFRPAPDVGPPPEELPVAPEVVEVAVASSVNVEAMGCGNGYEGSGFVVSEDIVATNAHVVAGADEIRLRQPDGGVVAATIRHVDPARDIALLDAPGIGRDPLPIRDSVVDEGAAVLGYPGGQDVPRIASAAVRDDRETIGRDIYGREVVERRLLYLSAQLRQGDSGSALIGTDGAVVGVVFAISPDDADTAFALHVEELRATLAATPNHDAGACL